MQKNGLQCFVLVADLARTYIYFKRIKLHVLNTDRENCKMLD